MSARRVVITGVGLVSPLGCGHEAVWRKLRANRHGITSLDERGFHVAGSGVTVGAFVPRRQKDSNGDDDADGYDEERVFGRIVSRELALATQYALYASDLALEHAGFPSSSRLELPCGGLRAGAAIASGGIGSLHDIIEGHGSLTASYKKVSPYFVPKVLMNMAAGHVSMRFGLKGPVTSVATACAAGAHSVGDAFNYIRLGYADMMLAGGTEACIDRLSVAGVARMKALSTNGTPGAASRPFDAHRDGFVIGEGAGVLVLEELAAAEQRGAAIVAEVLGFGVSGDAHHATHPPPDGAGAMRSMRQALSIAGVTPSQVGYINAHATSTPVGDAIEVRAIEGVFAPTSSSFPSSSSSSSAAAQPLFVSSTKGATGHLLGAAGALEAAVTALALRDGVVPATLNLDAVSDDCRWSSPHIHHVTQAETTYPGTLAYARSNSFGFGGTDVSLLLGKYK
jgi:3-oxoacyl-[acyl-carrier-protein] synthase II